MTDNVTLKMLKEMAVIAAADGWYPGHAGAINAAILKFKTSPTPETREMTDERLVERLAAIRNSVAADKTYAVHATEVLDAAIVRLKAAPPAPDSAEVRIAVAVSSDDRRDARIVRRDRDAETIESSHRSVVTHLDEWVTHEAIVTAHIPRRQIPVVTGSVEPFDPEATQ